MAPEVAKNQVYNEKVDMYSFGLILHEMLSGDAPFGGMKKDAFVRRVVEGGERPDLERGSRGRWIEGDAEVKQFIEKCWDRDAGKRPDAGAAYALLERLSKQNPSPPQSQSSGCACS
jgi:serine/threonine protein kinase